MHNILVKNASKKIKKDVVLDNIDLELVSDNIYGFIGRNGSGKSMLFRMLSGLMRPTSGTILVNGKVLFKDIFFVDRVGIVIENAGLYKEFTGLENLRYLAKFNNYISENEIIEAILRVGLNPEDKRTVKKYSLGMKQKLVLAQAIMEKPDFIFLDEPTNALDENGVELLRKIVKEERQRGAMVLIASHNKEDIEILCDKVFMMSEGRIVKEDNNQIGSC